MARNREWSRFHFSLFEIRKSFQVYVMDPDRYEFHARMVQVWCWNCCKVTTHDINFRWGGKCFLCKECGNIVVERLT